MPLIFAEVGFSSFTGCEKTRLIQNKKNCILGLHIIYDPNNGTLKVISKQPTFAEVVLNQLSCFVTTIYRFFAEA